MGNFDPVTRLAMRLTPLAACLAIIFGFSDSARAATVPVSSCADDGGANTLRQALLIANNGDVVDLSQLGCSTITLTAGALQVNLDSLTVKGAGAAKMTIDGAQAGRVFMHNGAGTLELDDVTVSHGKLTGDKVYGGCIYSKANVTLARSTVSSCVVSATTIAAGGGIVVLGNLMMDSSTVADNLAESAGTAKTVSAAAGGVFAHGQVTMHHSIVSGNTAQAVIGKAYGGGAFAASISSKYSTTSGNLAKSIGTVTDYSIGGGMVGSNIFVLNSTVDHNQADVTGGIFAVAGDPGFLTILGSTISSNVGNLASGGISAATNLTLSNSTVAFNTGGAFGGGGIVAQGANTQLQSSIIADNSPADFDSNNAFTGSGNLIKVAGKNVVLPAGTVTVDPKLGPLAYNGGSTRTHALAADSPAIDGGDNPTDLVNDQRGPGYARVVGGFADIGAYELDPDHIFFNAFD